MLRFVVCEDDNKFMERVCMDINKAMMIYKFDYKISKFNEYNEEVEKIIQDENEQKVYILDIELPVVSGLEIASTIREDDSDSSIIFLTAHPEFKNDIFYSRLTAIDYISKDKIWGDRLISTIKHIIKTTGKKKVLTFDFDCNTYRVPVKNITYIEKVQDLQKCLIHTLNGEEYEIISTITGLLDRVGPCFYKTHKACLTNVTNIKQVNYPDGIITFFNNEKTYLLSVRNKKGLKEYVSHF